MATTWILVAHQAGARIFENHGPGKGISLVDEVDHPEGRARDSELESDRPGRSFRKNSSDPRRAAMSRAEGPRDRAVADFARELAGKLQQARASNSYERLVLVAPPKFLGLLRGALDDSTASLVVGSIDKDLAMSGDDVLIQHLGEVIAV
jgi:protein required for attachment to host cells